MTTALFVRGRAVAGGTKGIDRIALVSDSYRAQSRVAGRCPWPRVFGRKRLMPNGFAGISGPLGPAGCCLGLLGLPRTTAQCRRHASALRQPHCGERPRIQDRVALVDRFGDYTSGGHRRRIPDRRPPDLGAGPLRSGDVGRADRTLLEHTAVPLQDAAGRIFPAHTYRPATAPLNRFRTVDLGRPASVSDNLVPQKGKQKCPSEEHSCPRSMVHPSPGRLSRGACRAPYRGHERPGH